MNLILVASDEKRLEYDELVSKLGDSYSISLFNKDKHYNSSNLIFVIIGGDGTLNYFINSLSSSTQVKIFYIPAGTANDFSKSLKLAPVEPSVKLFNDCLKSQFVVEVPLLNCNDKRFINVASCGLAAKITNESNTKNKRSLGIMSYYLSGIRNLFNDYELVIDVKFKQKQSSYKVKGFVVSQGLYAGGGARVSTSYVPTFGDSFNYIIIDNQTCMGTMANIAKVQLSGGDEIFDNEIVAGEESQLEISSNSPIDVKLDGEAYSSNKLTFTRSDYKLEFLLY